MVSKLSFSSLTPLSFWTWNLTAVLSLQISMLKSPFFLLSSELYPSCLLSCLMALSPNFFGHVLTLTILSLIFRKRPIPPSVLLHFHIQPVDYLHIHFKFLSLCPFHWTIFISGKDFSNSLTYIHIDTTPCLFHSIFLSFLIWTISFLSIIPFHSSIHLSMPVPSNFLPFHSLSFIPFLLHSVYLSTIISMNSISFFYSPVWEWRSLYGSQTLLQISNLYPFHYVCFNNFFAACLFSKDFSFLLSLLYDSGLPELRRYRPLSYSYILCRTKFIFICMLYLIFIESPTLDMVIWSFKHF